MTICLETGFLISACGNNKIITTGDGQNVLEFRSIPGTRSNWACFFCTTLQIIFSVEFVFGWIFSMIDWLRFYGIPMLVESSLGLIIYIIIQVVVMNTMEEVEVKINIFNKNLIVSHFGSKFCNYKTKSKLEFDLQDIFSIDPIVTAFCSSRFLGFTVRTSKKTYTTTSANFTVFEISQMQQFIQRFKLKAGGFCSDYQPSFTPQTYALTLDPSVVLQSSSSSVYPSCPSQTYPPYPSQIYPSAAPKRFPVGDGGGDSVGCGDGGGGGSCGGGEEERSQMYREGRKVAPASTLAHAPAPAPATAPAAVHTVASSHSCNSSSNSNSSSTSVRTNASSGSSRHSQSSRPLMFIAGKKNAKK